MTHATVGRQSGRVILVVQIHFALGRNGAGLLAGRPQTRKQPVRRELRRLFLQVVEIHDPVVNLGGSMKCRPAGQGDNP